jgi:threonyl-tRNA synthetase
MAREADDATRSLARRLATAGIRVGFDERGAEVDYRNQIKDASLLKVNYMALVGRREAEAGTVTVRVRGAEKQQATITGDELVARLRHEIHARALTLTAAEPPTA